MYAFSNKYSSVLWVGEVRKIKDCILSINAEDGREVDGGSDGGKGYD